MKRFVTLALVAVLGLAGALFFVQSRLTALGGAFDKELARARVTPLGGGRPAPATHENGLTCLDGMLRVAPSSFEPFTSDQRATLVPQLTGASAPPWPEALEQAIGARHRWAAGLLECADAAKLIREPQLFVWAPDDDPRVRALAPSVTAFALVTTLELRGLLAQGDFSTAAQRCDAAWSLAADLTHVGLRAAPLARTLLLETAPACADLLPKLTAEQRKVVSDSWTRVPARLATVDEVLAFEQVRVPALRFAPSLDGGFAWPTTPRWTTQREWEAWDTAFRAYLATATAKDARAARGQALAALGTPVEADVAALEEVHSLLTVLLSIPLGDSSPRPGVTRDEAAHTLTVQTSAGPLVLATP
ncbi:MAG: hypothetical protein U0228_08500 [Myxococcaceae bacterium]